MCSGRSENGSITARESRCEFRLLGDDRMTVTLVCRATLYFTALGRGRQLFVSVHPERIVVEADGGRREMLVPGNFRGDVAPAGSEG